MSLVALHDAITRTRLIAASVANNRIHLRGRIPVNPFSQLERGERPKHDDQRPKRILTLDEMRALLANTDNDQHRLLFELLLSSGLRIGEALGITVGDINAQDSLLRIEYQLARDGARTPLKTGAAHRTIDIAPALTQALLALAAQRGGLDNRNALIFASNNGNGLERKVVHNALKLASKAANLPAPHPTLHDLRHTHASMLIALEYSVVEVQHRLGHQNPDTTLRIYAHIWKYRDAQRSDIGSRINTLLTHPAQANGHKALPPPQPASTPNQEPMSNGRRDLTASTIV